VSNIVFFYLFFNSLQPRKPLVHGVVVLLHPVRLRWDVSTVHDLHLVQWAVLAVRAQRRHLLHHRHAVDNFSKHHMSVVEPGSRLERDVELAVVEVPPGVGHGQGAGAPVLQLEVLVTERVSVDALAAGAVVVGDVAALDHEAIDDAVEARLLVVEQSAVFLIVSLGQGNEVLCSERRLLAKDGKFDATNFAPIDSDVKEHLVSDL